MSLASVLADIKNHVAARTWAGKAIERLGQAVLDHVDEQVSMNFIASDDALTVDNDGNVAGLSSAIALANSLKATLNAHYADAGVAGEEHLIADTEISTADASNVSTLYTLTRAMLISYEPHNFDAASALPTTHQAQGTDKPLVSTAIPTTLLEAITRLNDLKAKLNDHMDDATAHTVGDSAQEAEDNAAMGAVVEEAISGVAVGDKVVWGILNGGSGSVTGVSAVAGADKLIITFSANPQADTIISHLILRQE